MTLDLQNLYKVFNWIPSFSDSIIIVPNVYLDEQNEKIKLKLKCHKSDTLVCFEDITYFNQTWLLEYNIS